jgi:antitoxin (DNA-binding transcriptional repressor) of toxin-antitoxin stability system
VVYLWAHAGSQVATEAVVDLRKVEAIGTGKARKELYEMLRRAQDGTHYLLLRFDRPVAALISHGDYLAFSELARQDALAKAVLQGKGYDPSTMTVQEFLDLLATNVKGEANAAD